MTRKDLTEIIVVLDRSGSMDRVREATIEAFNGYVASQSSGEGEILFTLIQFDHEYEAVMTGEPIRGVAPLTSAKYIPRGSTALYDAIGRAIKETGERYSQLLEEERPGCVIFVVQTDGFENSSRVYSSAQINAMISEQCHRYSWQFVFLGANQDAIASAGQVGIAADAALSYDANAACTQAAFKALAECTSEFRRGRARGIQSQVQWQFSAEARKMTKQNE